MSETDVDVVVVGAGPVGLLLACQVVRHGASVRVLEARSAPSSHSKASVVWPRAAEHLRAVGALDRFLAESEVLNGMTVEGYGEQLAHLDLRTGTGPHGAAAPPPPGMLIGQEVTERLLEERLEELGVRVERGRRVTGVAALAADGVAVEVEGSAPVRARFAVGCDGARSVVREALGIPFEGERYERHKLVQADARLRAGFPLAGGEARFWLRADGFLGALPLPAGTARLFALVPDPDPSDDRDPTLAEMEALLREITGDEVLELSDARWLSHTRFQHRRAARFADGPCFLAGDAARIVPPILGQGMNTGMQDASNLGWKLAYVARGRARPELLDSYAAEREAVADVVIARTDSAYRHLSDASGLQQALARTLGPRLAATDTLQQRVRDQLFGLAYAYPDASTAVGEGGGERAPDAVAVDRELRPTNVHALLEDGAYTALAFRGDQPGPDGAAALRARPGLRVVEVLRRPPSPGDLHRDVLADRDGLVHDRFSAHAGDLVLVRPDGYVALRTRHPAAVDDHLDTLLGAAG